MLRSGLREVYELSQLLLLNDNIADAQQTFFHYSLALFINVNFNSLGYIFRKKCH